MTEERISKKELMKLYNISRYTITEWVKQKELPLISISSHSNYIRKTDLIEWENKWMKNETNK